MEVHIKPSYHIWLLFCCQTVKEGYLNWVYNKYKTNHVIYLYNSLCITWFSQLVPRKQVQQLVILKRKRCNFIVMYHIQFTSHMTLQFTEYLPDILNKLCVLIRVCYMQDWHTQVYVR